MEGNDADICLKGTKCFCAADYNKVFSFRIYSYVDDMKHYWITTKYSIRYFKDVYSCQGKKKVV